MRWSPRGEIEMHRESEATVKRVYWSIGGGSVLLGAWFLASFFGHEEPVAPTRTGDVRPQQPQPASISPKSDEEPEVVPVVPAPQAVQQEVNALYASAVADRAGDTPEEVSVNEQVSLLRKPVIDAIRLLNVSKAEKYDRMREVLRDSGDSVEVWTRQAPGVFAGWSRLLDGKGNAELDERSVRCYLAGCEAQVYFESEAEYEAAAKAFRSLSESDTAHGGRVQTPPKQLEDGRWVAAWLMMRPNVGVE